ncbi:hypothetical protein SACS_1687 [Parasaccharibacter apium]|uniref:Uncharacterized protein n=1 Tax=Parasaccharibacter apium TaxID=1510841 RepID=A0A7U7G7J6_9PROT|nr:hypothetical protein SACS_1687 [Parasaccharibacter apium]
MRHNSGGCVFHDGTPPARDGHDPPCPASVPERNHVTVSRLFIFPFSYQSGPSPS